MKKAERKKFFEQVKDKKIKLYFDTDDCYFIPRSICSNYSRMIGDYYNDDDGTLTTDDYWWVDKGFEDWQILPEQEIESTDGSWREKYKEIYPVQQSVVKATAMEDLGAGTAVKHDQGKPNMALLPTSLLKGVTEVLDFGAKKYASHNWRQGFAWSRTYSAALRHLTAWNDGESVDSESGLSHLKHAACNLAFLIEFEEKRIGKDDRYKKSEEK